MTEADVVYVVEDDAMVRQSLALLLGTMAVEVRSFATGRQFLDSISPDCLGCVVLDLRLPGLSGLEVQAALLERGLNLPIIFITGHGDVPLAVEAMRGGAIDFLQKPFDGELLLGRVREALAAGREQKAQREQHEDAAARLDTLSRREREVLALVVEGRMNKTIAAELGISAKTVEDHRASIMRKTATRSVAELVKLATVATRPA
ncbi:Response regulator protein TmoT [Burkholderiales bacterium]|nr:MAG: response regulator transcription factor [Burkholderiales bacterium]CAG1009589.1 Response regulator protein TmoT [Burkholderiales bacterium]